jgi:hypothetical protein
MLGLPLLHGLTSLPLLALPACPTFAYPASAYPASTDPLEVIVFLRTSPLCA